jgi:ribosomal protein S12 methylthiotransferase accessory factor
VPFRSPKSYIHGTHRTQAPEETFELIEPFLEVAGVTRIADVTGLDRVGLPVTLAIRPNAPTMACSSGKGLTTAAAYVSGAMEAIELHAAETAVLPSIRASYNQMSVDHAVPAVDQLPLTKRSLFNKEWPFHWSLGWDIVTQEELTVPLASLEMSRSRALVTDLGAFQVSSNGLASGNSFLEAVAAALYEVIERDGVACHHAAWQSGHSRPRYVAYRHAHSYTLVSEVLEKCYSADLDVKVIDCTSDIQVPTYLAYVYSAAGDDGVGVFCGYGAHLDPEIAMIRAITEALQGRLNFIAGARDDIFRSAFWRNRRTDPTSFARAVEIESQTTSAAPIRQSIVTTSFEGDIDVSIRQLKAAGLQHVVVVDLTPVDFPGHVVRVVVPGLEGYMHYGYRPGMRALRYSQETPS